jgi:hypothetical protein
MNIEVITRKKEVTADRKIRTRFKMRAGDVV